MKNMDQSPDIIEQALQSSMKRRDFLTKAAAAGVVAWSAPVILSRPAYADAMGGTPKCQPNAVLTCTTDTLSCGTGPGNGNKAFPGVHIAVDSTCPCSSGHPTVCVIVKNLMTDNGQTIVAYGPNTNCSPLNQGGHDDRADIGNWVCGSTGGNTLFFGKGRQGNGSIGELGSATITFTLGVWVGGCLDHSGRPAFKCQTWDVSINWVSQGNSHTTTCTPGFPRVDTNPMNSLCTTATGDGTSSAPCTC